MRPWGAHYCALPPFLSLLLGPVCCHPSPLGLWPSGASPALPCFLRGMGRGLLSLTCTHASPTHLTLGMLSLRCGHITPSTHVPFSRKPVCYLSS